MKISLVGLELVSPIIAASGTFGYGIEFEEIVSLERIGAFVTKGISIEPMAGHTPPRLIQPASGMLTAVGLHALRDEYTRTIEPARTLSTAQTRPIVAAACAYSRRTR